MRKIYLSLITFTLITQLFAQLPSDSLVGYFPLNGNANDFSELENHGAVSGAILTSDRFGNESSAYLFDGIDDYIITSADIDDSLSNGASFSAWIKYTGNSTGRILSNYYGQGTVGDCVERIGFVFGVTADSSLNIFYATDGNDYVGKKTEIGSIKRDSWHLVTGTWNGLMTPDAFRLYIDGERKDVEIINEGTMGCGFLESLKEFHIGLGDCASGSCGEFKGTVDEVRIYSKVLDSLEISSLYNETYTNISNVEKPSLRVFPNPTNGIIHITFENHKIFDNCKVNILNISSQIIYTQSINSSQTTLDLENDLKSGIYFLQILKDDKIIDNHKIVIY